jgi:hypothetical protein
MYCIARRCVLPSFSKEQAESLLAGNLARTCFLSI